jgi:ferric-dicitrate binding protein FerR (iron transport regulator)
MPIRSEVAAEIGPGSVFWTDLTPRYGADRDPRAEADNAFRAAEQALTQAQAEFEAACRDLGAANRERLFPRPYARAAAMRRINRARPAYRRAQAALAAAAAALATHH